MLPYWGLWLTFAAGALAPYRTLIGGRLTIPLMFAAVLLTVFVGLRWDVGADWLAYEFIFDRYRFVDLANAVTQTDPAFYFLVWTANDLGLNIWALNLFCAAIFIFGLLKFSLRQPNPWLALLVAIPYLVIVVGMSATRQATALGLAFYGLSLLGRRSLVHVFIWIFVGALFHASAVILAILVAASYARNRLQAVGLLLLAAAPGYYALFGAFDEYVRRYTESDVDSGGVWVRVAMNALPALLLLTFRRRFGFGADEQPVWTNLAILSLMLVPANLVIESTTVVDRLSLYATPLQLLVLSRLPQIFSRGGSGAALWTTAVVGYSGLTLAVYLLLATHAEYYLPYRFVTPW